MEKINRKKAKDGDIIELEIAEWGYIYFKFIDIINLRPNSNYPALIRVFKTLYKQPVSNIMEIDRELLFAPKIIQGTNSLIKKLPTRIVLNESLSDDDKILPDVKLGFPTYLYEYEDEKYEEWEVLHYLGEIRNMSFCKYSKVKHLEWAGSLDILSIPFRIKMELYKLVGKDIKLEDGLKDFSEQCVYDMAKNLPIYSRLNPKTRDFVYI